MVCPHVVPQSNSVHHKNCIIILHIFAIDSCISWKYLIWQLLRFHKCVRLTDWGPNGYLFRQVAWQNWNHAMYNSFVWLCISKTVVVTLHWPLRDSWWKGTLKLKASELKRRGKKTSKWKPECTILGSTENSKRQSPKITMAVTTLSIGLMIHIFTQSDKPSRKCPCV